jgi:hypothetical protein
LVSAGDFTGKSAQLLGPGKARALRHTLSMEPRELPGAAKRPPPGESIDEQPRAMRSWRPLQSQFRAHPIADRLIRVAQRTQAAEHEHEVTDIQIYI